MFVFIGSSLLLLGISPPSVVVVCNLSQSERLVYLKIGFIWNHQILYRHTQYDITSYFRLAFIVEKLPKMPYPMAFNWYNFQPS